MSMRAVLMLLLLALEPAFVKATVETLGATIGREYFDPKVAVEADAALKRSLDGGRYAAAADDETLARLITADLYAVTHDKHLAMQALRDVPPERERSAAQADESRAATVRRANAG